MLNRIQQLFWKIPPIFRNIFFLTAVLFAVWMLFFDENNLLNQWQRRKELHELQGKRDFYKKQIQQVNQQYEEITTNRETQEKFAREQYRMKKDSEDVFVIVEK
ncbi:MAG: septum formation initiator family protein [Chitinophagales bacterium]